MELLEFPTGEAPGPVLQWQSLIEHLPNKFKKPHFHYNLTSNQYGLFPWQLETRYIEFADLDLM